MRIFIPHAIIIVYTLTASLHATAQSMLITNVKLIDGTGIPARNASVRINGDKIIEVGNLKPANHETVFDGQGKMLCPGFIDTHSHLGESLKYKPEAIAALSQGVTTIVSGQDGYSTDMDTLRAEFQQKPPAINLASYTGQSDLREKVLGKSNLGRAATKEEIEKMQALLNSELDKGSLGLSTGLEYEEAYFSSKEEVLELAKTAAAKKARYISHMRSEDLALDQAVTEIIRIGKEAGLPVQISHIKIALKDAWGSAPALLARLDSARNAGIDITADCYPYVYWSSTLRVLFPKTDYTNPISAQFAVDHTFDPAKSVLTRFAPQPAYKGKTISAIAAMRKESTARTLMALIAMADSFSKAHPDSGRVESIVATSMREDDLRNLLAWPQTNICSDGSDGGHPRGYGTFTRVLGRYTREQKLLKWEEAIYKMTSLSAEHTGIRDRGIVAPGRFADLVLIDPDKVLDKAGIGHATDLSQGIEDVWVNGVLVYKDLHPTHHYPGTLIIR